MATRKTKRATRKKSTKTAGKSSAKRGASKSAGSGKAVKSSDPMSASRRIDKMIADLGDWRGERLAGIRKLIHEVDSEVVEEWKWKGTPVWSHEGMYALANPHKGKVKLTFLHGARLSDPRKLFNAGLGGNKWRAIDFHEEDKIDKSALKALLRAAVAYNTTKAAPNEKSRRVAKPTLLASGNPQIAKAEGDAPVQAYIAAMPGWKRDVGSRLDTIIVRTVPGVRKAVKWNSPFYGIQGQGWFLSFHCFTKYVKVTFFRGTSLRPVPPGKSKHEDVRYLDIHEDDQLDQAQFAGWVKQASGLPGWATADIL